MLLGADVTAILMRLGGLALNTQRPATAYRHFRAVAERMPDWHEPVFLQACSAAAALRLNVLPILPERNERPLKDFSAQIIQYWHDETPPPDVVRTMKTWHGSTPGLEHRVFSAATALAWLREHVGDAAVEAFNRAHHPAMQADLFRLYFLRAEGGVYVDADEACRRPPTPLCAALGTTELVLAMASEPVPYAHNFFFVARVGSRVISMALEEIEARMGSQSGHLPIWDTTGPGCVTRALSRAIAALPSVREAHAVAAVMTEEHYRTFTRTEEDLEYKRTRAGNWRLA